MSYELFSVTARRLRPAATPQALVLNRALRACIAGIILLAATATSVTAQTTVRPAPAQVPAPTQQVSKTPTHADILRGEYGRYRANNDLLSYPLDIRVDSEKKFLSGKTTIRFKMLKDDTRIQLDLHEALRVDKILFVSPKSNLQSPTSATGATSLKYERDSGGRVCGLRHRRLSLAGG